MQAELPVNMMVEVPAFMACDIANAAALQRERELAEENAALAAEIERLRADVEIAKARASAVPDDHDYSESETRDLLIDLALRVAGCSLYAARDRGFEVTGMSSESGKGRVDYVLWGDDGAPLALVEAKRTRRDATVGQHQAKLYADARAAFAEVLKLIEDRYIDPADLDAKNIAIPDPGTELEHPAGEKAARRRWKRFAADPVGGYDTDRDRPDRDNSSRMSAYLHFGNIHPRTMAADLDTRAAGPRAYLRELAFRDFYATVLAQWPRSAWWNFNTGFDAIEVDDGPEAEAAFAAWQEGRTGFPIVDAGMRQLRQTGFMPNRVRMIVASFLVKDLHLPWQWGARWFLDQLVDGDVASNNHGWQWAAGSGTDAAPYFRVFNPQTQAGKFDPDGTYVRRWIPELGDSEHPGAYPAPIVDHGRERAEALRRYQRIR